ncbi:HD-GYP domain, c-di-GMP phosphodiesterase class II (or its inactivated variant) [Pseudobutyrivibrio sp. YE44]|uniref:HD-GYP domain-containing protein n=1 Tax=Pseudobutyrivibrio sp. YE44 TaxID=1520802 RepID=UPI000890C343|nr:HD-GYP domain-containing protein [Pseudobutyrivibrio sp. YE44]SDB34994.1 HD-GYP domain, c-di-GMP phosphodiesterase class II (or its inactivated variant) [Pseudobutyrivibrio sp. YE44]
MTKEIDGFISDLPKGCITETDIYTDRGVLLCPKMTIMDSKMLEALSQYKGRIHVIVSYTQPETTDETPEEDKSVTFEDSFKKYAEESLTSIFNNVDDVDSLTSGAKEIGEEVFSIIDDSKDLFINLSKLKVSDEYTYKHSVDVGTMAAVLAKALGESKDFVHDVTISGLLHDVGKEKIPAEVINKPARLTPEEFDIIKTHPVHGYRLLSESKDITEDMRQGILNHHENVDGTGYPRGLLGDRIGKMGQILSIVDVYDALVTKRSYKEAKTPGQAIEIMFTMSNKFNMDYFKSFLSVINAFPNGSEVLLSSGEKAIVMRQNKSYPLRPVIKLVNTGQIVNLASDPAFLSTVIMNFVNTI